MVGQQIWDMYEWRMRMGEDVRRGEKEGTGIVAIQKNATEG